MLVADASLVRTEARGSVRDGWTAARMEARGRATGGPEDDGGGEDVGAHGAGTADGRRLKKMDLGWMWR